jgi:hypothetical protein
MNGRAVKRVSRKKVGRETKKQAQMPFDWEKKPMEQNPNEVAPLVGGTGNPRPPKQSRTGGGA